MAERTRIITVEFTKVFRCANEDDQEEFGNVLDVETIVLFPDIFDDVKIAKIQDFIFPDQQKQKLTKREKEFCEFMKCGWIARDKEKNLYWYNSKPYKNETTWNNNNSEYICMDLLNTPFAFIQWEDDEPWDVSELRKLEVEE